MERLAQLQTLVKSSDKLHITSELLDYSGVVEYYPEELVITVKAGTKIQTIQAELGKNNQSLPFYIPDNSQSIGAAYALGGQDLSDSVLGVQLIDGTGELLNFGGQVMKNVAGYDVSRLLVGSKGALAMVVQISFKILPSTYINKHNAPTETPGLSVPDKPSVSVQQAVERRLKQVFDPSGMFE